MPTPDAPDDHQSPRCVLHSAGGRAGALRCLLPTLLLVMGLTACGGGADEPAAATSAPTGETTVPDPTPRDVDPALADVVDVAVADLAARIDVPPSEITVASAEMVSWGDTSLGCPQPGMKYAQVVTDGTRVVLEHDGTTYDYHAGGDRPDPFLCELPEAPVKSSTPTIDERG